MPRIVTVSEGAPTEAQREEKMESLRAKLKNASADFRTDDIFLYRFLFCCDWDVEAAFSRIVRIAQHKQAHSQWFMEGSDIEEYQRLLRKNIKFMLEKRDKNGRRIYLTKMANVNTNDTNVTDQAKLDDLWFTHVFDEKETIENGVSVVIDMKGYTWKMLKWLTPANVKIAASTADLTPIKHMEFHIVNSSKLLNTAVALIFPFLGQRLKDQIHFHYADMKSLHKFIGSEALPPEYGGDAELDCASLYAEVVDRVRMEQKQRPVENLIGSTKQSYAR